MSDSEDDFMSDKFLNPTTVTTSTAAAAKSARPLTYSERRNLTSLKSFKTHAQTRPMKQHEREELARREALNTSLFDRVGRADIGRKVDGKDEDGGDEETRPKEGLSKAMGMMMKMGWKVGEGLGASTSTFTSTAPAVDGTEGADENQVTAPTADLVADRLDEEDEEPSFAGIGKRKRDEQGNGGGGSRSAAEPIRVSMWAGQAGIGTHRPRSPSPILPSTELHPLKLAKLSDSTEAFRRSRGAEQEKRRVEGKEWSARKILVELDERRGVKFHPLHVIPSHPKETIPRPLLRIVLPDVGLELDASHPDETAPLPDPVIGKPLDENKSEAERMREMMKRDALDEVDDLDGEEEGEKEGKVAMKNAMGMKHNGLNGASGPPAADTSDPSEAPIDWYSHVSGVNRVLAMDAPTHLSFLVSTLREDHLYCFWCAAKYGSFEEMDGPGGCPGEEEDAH